jgi:hypothetical protein
LLLDLEGYEAPLAGLLDEAESLEKPGDLSRVVVARVQCDRISNGACLKGEDEMHPGPSWAGVAKSTAISKVSNSSSGRVIRGY